MQWTHFVYCYERRTKSVSRTFEYCEVLLCDPPWFTICWVTQRERRLDNAHLIPPSRHYPPPNSNFIWQWLHAHAIFLHFHRHLSLFEWSLLILARTLIWNRIWTTHMQRCNSNKFKLASMDFWYSERHDIRTGLEASAVDSHSTLNHFLVLWNYHCRFTVDWKWTLERM